MNTIFAQRRARLLEMKTLRERYVPADQTVCCPSCGGESHRRDVARNLDVCPRCGHHFPIGAYYRLSTVLDSGTFRELNAKYPAGDPLTFPGYREKLEKAQRKTGLGEAAVTAVGAIGGVRCVVGVMDSRFLMGSMSAAVGEKLTRAVEYAAKAKAAADLFLRQRRRPDAGGDSVPHADGQDHAALERFARTGRVYLSVLTDPTTGGVTASFASLGDIILAEPGALIGFAGPRVIQQTIGQTLPEGFQRAEFQMEHGFVDAVVPRAQMRDTLSRLLRIHTQGGRT
ncbi:MAG: acetyl-CoA carboxylase carboxyltransferase subunit beta [Oscillospiraceae bacterium]